MDCNDIEDRCPMVLQSPGALVAVFELAILMSAAYCQEGTFLLFDKPHKSSLLILGLCQ